jgi:hypothetical protein
LKEGLAAAEKEAQEHALHCIACVEAYPAELLLGVPDYWRCSYALEECNE